MKPEKSGLRAETYNCTTPFAKLTAIPEKLSINALGRKFEFKPEEIIGFKKRAGGIQVHHINKNINSGSHFNGYIKMRFF